MLMKLLHKLEIVVGVWVLVSPWILGFYGFTPALWSGIISGAAIALIGLWGVFEDR